MTALREGAIPQAWRPRPATRLPVVIGLINNMPDAEFDMTEFQYRRLLFAAMPPGAALQLRLFRIDDIPRSAERQFQISQRYESIDMLWTARLDGLIVSGLEPRMARLRDEPYWSTLSKLFDWAARHTQASIFSCLAAHAAVLHFDGIERQPLSQKLCGVFDCAKTADAASWSEMPDRWAFPHSRYNDLNSETLLTAGYRISSRSSTAGVDIFEKRIGSEFTFMQGHPEYDAGALLREYKRDVRRFLAGKREAHPNIPANYFDRFTEARLRTVQILGQRDHQAEILRKLLDLSEDAPPHLWQRSAIQFFRQWFGRLHDGQVGDAAGAAIDSGSTDSLASVVLPYARDGLST